MNEINWKKLHQTKWRLLAHSQGGHRFYGSLDGGQHVAVADDSMRRGSDPTSTDDGLILLDAEKISIAGIRGDGRHFSFPVIHPDGESRCVGTVLEAEVVAGLVASLGFPRPAIYIDTKHGRFNLTRAV